MNILNRRWTRLGARCCVVVSLAASVPAFAETQTSVELVLLLEGNTLLRLRAEDPGTTQAPTGASIVTDPVLIPVRGIKGRLLGIDVRPSNQLLYGITGEYALVTIDPTSGAARRVSTLTAAFDAGVSSGFDFNPQADRLRLAGANGQNLRVNVDVGAAAVDGPLVYKPRDRNAARRPTVTACAYTRSLPRAPTTRLFDIDAALDVLALQDPPNDGVLRTVGPLRVDFGALGGFDISSGPDGSEKGFAASGTTLYRIDLESGAATAIGEIAIPIVGDKRPQVLGLAILGGPPAVR